MKTGSIQKKVLMAASLAAVLAVSASEVQATSTTLNATATFLGAITLTPTSMAYGNVTYAATPGASDTVTLTTAGAISYAGTFADGGGTKAAGNIAITATTAQVMTVDCSASAVLAQNAGAGRITINQIKVADVTNAAGGGSTCTGTGNTVLTFTYVTAGDNAIKVGGRIDGSTQVSWGGGSYSTANTGGTAITVNVLYQ
jgi:hypothetical protein